MPGKMLRRATHPLRHGRRDDAVVALRSTASPPPFLLRIPITSPTWAEALPPLPDGARVTVVFSDEDAEGEHADAVALLGYRVAGSLRARAQAIPTADLLIPRRAVDRWPVWRDGLLAAGGRVYDLSFGPVARALAEEIAAHDTQLAS